jgi:GNAT superfamily N-acetyltransferase
MQAKENCWNRAVLDAEFKDKAKIVDIFVDAFSEDPFFRWLFPTRPLLTFLFDLIVQEMLPYGHVKYAEGESGAIAALPPEVSFASWISISYALKYLIKIGAISTARVMKMIYLVRDNFPNCEHYYIYSLGTRSHDQGHGIGSLLLDQLLKCADRDRKLTYLENSNERNLPFYCRHGFELKKHIVLDKKGTSLWLMHREPQY